jgi:hypothetical protein
VVQFEFPQGLSRRATCGKLWAMAKPEHYAPRLKDPVLVDGVVGRLVVVGVDDSKKTVTVATSTPVIVQTVPWSKLSYLDESQNAARIVREATEDRSLNTSNNSPCDKSCSVFLVRTALPGSRSLKTDLANL